MQDKDEKIRLIRELPAMLTADRKNHSTRTMTRLLLWTALVSLFSCGQNNNGQTETMQTNKIEKYVSLSCETGDITLIINSDSTFNMTILFWDNVLNKHTGQESINGHWFKKDDLLNLVTSDNNKINYKKTNTKLEIGGKKVDISTYAFISNDKIFFGSGHDMLGQMETDKFLKQTVVK